MFKTNEVDSQPHWERKTVEKVLLEHIKEHRRARRWGIFFKLVVVGVFGYAAFKVFNRDIPQATSLAQPHTAVIDIQGEISANEVANADDLRDSLKSAFENKQVKGVILRINSPGGSPVQSRQIYSEIRALRLKYPDIKLYAAIEDMGASAAYLIASAADAIYADKTSLVGSIGVRLDSFGFVDAMNKIGVERRLYVAGKNKGMLDPYLPRDAEQEAFINQQLEKVHQAFIDNVKEGRGERLRITPEIFSGLFWSGSEALDLGLIDGLGDAQYIAKEIVKIEHLIDYTPRVSLIDKLAHKLGASLGAKLASHLGLMQTGVR